MKTRNRLLLFVFLFAFCDPISSMNAQTPGSTFETTISKQADTEMKTISGWRARGYMLAGITTAIAVLGVVAGFVGKNRNGQNPPLVWQ